MTLLAAGITKTMTMVNVEMWQALRYIAPVGATK